MAIYAVAPELREAFDLDPFYKKDVDAGGIPILASRELSNDALIAARGIVAHMLSRSPELYEPLRHNKIRIAIIASDLSTTDKGTPTHWGYSDSKVGDAQNNTTGVDSILEIFRKDGKRICALDFDTSKERFKRLLSDLRSWVANAEPGREFVGSVRLVFKLWCLSQRLGFTDGPANYKPHREGEDISFVSVDFTMPDGGPVCRAVPFVRYMSQDEKMVSFHPNDDVTKDRMLSYIKKWRTAADEAAEPTP